MRFDPSLRDTVEQLHIVLQETDARLATAESCTGGMVGAAITDVAGASDVYEGGMVTYSNEAKVRHLGIDPTLIHTTGAVSGPTARAMATAIRDLADVAWGLSITGIAGPAGGRPGKPVGTVYIGIATDTGDAPRSFARRVRFDGDRHAIRYQTTRFALERLVSAIERDTQRVD